MHVAASIGSVALMEKMLAAGAEDDACDSNGWTPLHEACRYGRLGAVTYLLGETTANVGAKTHSGRTPLHYASMAGHLKVVALLLASEAEADARDNKDTTPLHLAAGHARPEVVKILLDTPCAAAIVGACDSEGWSPLHRACWVGCTETVKMLILAGANRNIKNNFGLTPVDLSNSPEICALFGPSVKAALP